MLKRPEFQISTATQALYDLMVERAQTDDPVITNTEIEKMSNKGIGEARGLFYTARRRFRRDVGKWWANISKIGYRLIDDEQLHECGKKNRMKSRNLHRETVKILALGDPKKMSKEAHTKTILEKTVAELGLAATAPRTLAKTEQIVTRSHNELTSDEQISAIKEALTKK